MEDGPTYRRGRGHLQPGVRLAKARIHTLGRLAAAFGNVVRAVSVAAGKGVSTSNTTSPTLRCRALYCPWRGLWVGQDVES